MKSGRRLLFLPATLACLSAVEPEIPFRWSLGPLAAGRSALIEVSYSEAYYGEVYGFCDAYRQGSDGWRLIDFELPKNMPKGKDGYRTYTYSLPSGALRENDVVTFTFGLSKEPYHIGIDYSKFFLRVKEVAKIGKPSGVIVFEKDEIREQNYDIYVYDPKVNRQQRQIYHEAYESMGIAFNRALTSRKLPLGDLKLRYLNPYLSAYEAPEAELRILTHGDDFASIATNYGGFYALPLKVSVSSTSGGMKAYTFGLKKSYYYSRIDWKAHPSAPKDEPYFLSSDLFLPLRLTHDTALYSYQVVLHKAGHFQDEIILPSSCFDARRFFGPCGKAEYCLTVGGEKP